MIKNDRGQSTIEFIITFAFGVSLILMVFFSALGHVKGYLLHYATFMASRTYLVAESYSGTISQTESWTQVAEQKSRETFSQYMLDAAIDPDPQFYINAPTGNASEALTVGAFSLLSLRIDALGKVAGQTKLELSSESYLGKEPTRAHCANRACVGVTGQTTCDQTMDVTLYDNGC
jgi:hypothetical protein